MKTIYIVITLYVQFRHCQSLFFHKPTTTLSSAQLAVQDKIKDIVLQCMEEEKSDPLHVYALFAFGAQNLPAKCVLRCVMHNCHLMDEEGHYDEQKVEEIMRKTQPTTPKPKTSRFSIFGRNKASDNETLKECIDKDPKNDSCERAYVFTKCVQKQTQKSFNKLTDDFFSRASNDTFEIESIETTTSSILNTLQVISRNGTAVEADYNETSLEANNDDMAMGTGCNATTEGIESSNDTTVAIEDSNNVSAIRMENCSRSALIEMETATAGLENGGDTSVGIENSVHAYNAGNTTEKFSETHVDNVSIWKKVFSIKKHFNNFRKFWIL